MRSDYIGKHLYQSVHFIPAFHALIREIEAGMKKEERDALPEIEPDTLTPSPAPLTLASLMRLDSPAGLWHPSAG